MVKTIFLKILGVILLLLGLLISISTLLQIPKIIQELSNSISYGFGYLLGSLIFVVIAYFLIKYGLKFLINKKSKEVVENIDDIGNI